jgi:hypothetical protein
VVCWVNQTQKFNSVKSLNSLDKLSREKFSGFHQLTINRMIFDPMKTITHQSQSNVLYLSVWSVSLSGQSYLCPTRHPSLSPLLFLSSLFLSLWSSFSLLFLSLIFLSLWSSFSFSLIFFFFSSSFSFFENFWICFCCVVLYCVFSFLFLFGLEIFILFYFILYYFVFYFYFDYVFLLTTILLYSFWCSWVNQGRKRNFVCGVVKNNFN